MWVSEAITSWRVAFATVPMGRVVGGVHLPPLNHDVAERFGLAEERHAQPFLGVRKSGFLVGAIVDRTFDYFAFACSTRAVAAAVRKHNAFTQRRIEYGFIIERVENVVAGTDSDLIRHGKARLLRPGW